MSYILDALKRSDRERRQSQIPDLESVHVSAVSAEPRRLSNSSLVLGIVLLGNVVFAGLWLYESLSDKADQPQHIQDNVGVQLRTEPATDMPMPQQPEIRFDQPLPKPLPTVPDPLPAAQATDDREASAAYVARQGIGDVPVDPPVDLTPDLPAPASRAAAAPTQTVVPPVKPRPVPRSLDDLSPNNDPYASLFDKNLASSPSAPDPVSAPSPAANQPNPARPVTPGTSSEAQTQLLPGEEIIRPRSASASPTAPPAASQGSASESAPSALEPELIKPRTPRADSGGVRVGGRGTVTWESVPLITDLPEVLRAELPPLNFMSHTFSSDPRFRTVIINGQSLRENDFLDARTRLMLITEAGVVLQFDEVRFKVAVLEGWSQ